MDCSPALPLPNLNSNNAYGTSFLSDMSSSLANTDSYSVILSFITFTAWTLILLRDIPINYDLLAISTSFHSPRIMGQLTRWCGLDSFLFRGRGRCRISSSSSFHPSPTPYLGPLIILSNGYLRPFPRGMNLTAHHHLR